MTKYIILLRLLTTVKYELPTTSLLVLLFSNLHILSMEHGEVFESRHLDLDPIPEALAGVAGRTVPRLSVEFLRTEGPKPHLVFNLAIGAPLDQPNPNSTGVRLTMEWNGADEDNGGFEVHDLPYIGSSRKATAEFDFPTSKKNLKTKYWWHITQGRSSYCTAQHRSDLTQFDIVYTRETEDAVDGCRDFMYVDRRPTLKVYVYSS
jgi:hypothetical protein